MDAKDDAFVLSETKQIKEIGRFNSETLMVAIISGKG